MLVDLELAGKGLALGDALDDSIAGVRGVVVKLGVGLETFAESGFECTSPGANTDSVALIAGVGPTDGILCSLRFAFGLVDALGVGVLLPETDIDGVVLVLGVALGLVDALGIGVLLPETDIDGVMLVLGVASGLVDVLGVGVPLPEMDIDGVVLALGASR